MFVRGENNPPRSLVSRNPGRLSVKVRIYLYEAYAIYLPRPALSSELEPLGTIPVGTFPLWPLAKRSFSPWAMIHIDSVYRLRIEDL